MPTFVLDIETALDHSIAPLIRKRDDSDDSMPPVWAQRITCLGLAVLNDDMTIKSLSVGCMGASERDGLSSLSKVANGYKFVTFNGRSFDIPIILNRMMYYGIQAPWYYSNPDYRYRYSDKGHLDLMDFLSDFGAVSRKDRYSLNALATILGLPLKLEFDHDGQSHPEKLAEYCLVDVLITTLSYYKFSYFRGAIDKQYFQSLIEFFVKILTSEIQYEYKTDHLSPLRNLIEPDVPAESIKSACTYILSATDWHKFGLWG